MTSFSPPDKEELEGEFQRKKSQYEILGARVKEILETLLRREQIETLPLTMRVKKFDSFFEKIWRYKITKDYFEIEDIAGVRIVCTFFSDLERIGNIIEDKFKIVKIKRRTIYRRIEEFGYQSDHYIVKVPDELKIVTDGQTVDLKLPADNEIMHLKCEVQVRTLLMHAWAAVSQELDYKQQARLGDELKRELYAVSGVLFLADQRFDAYRKAREKELSKTEEKIAAIDFDLNQDVTSNSLEKYLEWRFTARQASLLLSYEDLAEKLKKMNYRDLNAVDQAIRKARGVLSLYEREYPPSSMPGAKFDRVGAARICIALADTRNKESRSFYVIDLDRFRAMMSESS